MNFKDFSSAVYDQFERMCDFGELFYTDVDKDELWNLYLCSFPDGTNPLYKERTEHDCNCCKQFIRVCGSVVALNSEGMHSIWDVDLPGAYGVVAKAMSSYVKSKSIGNVYRYESNKLGTKQTVQLLDSGETLTWNHFYFDLPRKFVNRAPGTFLSSTKANKDVLERSIKELTLESAEIVLDLIIQGSLYRGEEYKQVVNNFIASKSTYDLVSEENRKDQFLWRQSVALKEAGRYKNTVIGTLLSDISDGIDLESAVGKYEAKVAPQNYKRSSALITTGMIKKAEEKVMSLGVEDALYRRHASINDITINNVLHANRESRINMGVFDSLKECAKTEAPSLDKLQEVDIDTFVNDILPTANSVELYLENKHEQNLVTLMAPESKDAKSIFKWDNNFSWTYNGDVTDSIKQRVKAAGGNVEGDVRVSLSWFNYDDLDLSITTPNRRRVFYGRNCDRPTGLILDVDMNAGSGTTREAVENIFTKDINKLPKGNYKVFVHNYAKRENTDIGFQLEVDILGKSSVYFYKKAVGDNKKIHVLTLTSDGEGNVSVCDVDSDLTTASTSKEMWGINTCNYKKVNVIMNSPNYWDDNNTGLKHIFFMLDGCKNPYKCRGFYNEYLSNEFTPERKVFEVLGAKTMAEYRDDQLSGVGFSYTGKNEVVVKVEGSFNRILKVKI